MPNKIYRPDKQAAKESLRNVSSTLTALNSILANEAVLRQSAEREANEPRHASVIAELAALDVETLNANKDGIRIAVLKNAGINNIAQLVGMPLDRLTHINGIGEQSAVKIRTIVDDMYRAVLVSAKVRIDVKNRNSHQDALVKNLFDLKRTSHLCVQARNLLAGEPGIQSALREAKPASGTLRWLFSSKGKREAAVRANEYLASLGAGRFCEDGARISEEHSRLTKDLPIDAAYSDFEQNAASYYALLENIGVSAGKTTATGLPAELVSDIEAYPLDISSMRTELRHYQTFGAKYVLRQEKTLLGDEMGLGKTIQALAAICDLKAKGESHFLVVCPASVLVNWKRETDKHTDLPAIIIHGWDKADELAQWKQQGGVGVTNFESLLGLADIIDFNFGMMVVDEAHFVKNPQARRTKALLAAAEKTTRILYMTGTPLENRVDEMCFLVSCLRADIAQKLSSMKTLSNTSKFKDELAPVYLRRVRDDVLTELPDLVENEDWLEPTDQELRSYAAAVQEGNFMAMRRISWDLETKNSTKAGRLMEICDEALDEGLKVIVFSFFLDTLNKICAMLGARALGPITGGISNDMRQKLIDEFTAADGGKVLVAQVQAGGVGLNIQAASIVVFAEPQIKPSLESQAISRAYRMGQVRDVQVHRLLCENTIDERMMQILRAKQTEFDNYAEESVVGTESLKAKTENAWVKSIIEEEKARVAPLIPNA